MPGTWVEKRWQEKEGLYLVIERATAAAVEGEMGEEETGDRRRRSRELNTWDTK